MKQLPRDPATNYAKQVSRGKIVACQHIVNACKRHLSDLQRDDLIWQPKRAQDCVNFFQQLCTVVVPATQQVVPLTLLPWQQFLVYSLFGWAVKEGDKHKRIPGTRRFRKIFLTSAKASGKSALFAGLHLYLMVRDHYVDLQGQRQYILAPETVVCASKKEQAVDLAMRGIADMVLAHPDLREVVGCEVVGGNNPHRVICASSGGKIEAIPARKSGTGLRGRKLHAAHMEETSESNDRELWDAVISGLKVSPQPLITIATNPPSFMFGTAYDEYRAAALAAEGDPQHDDILGLIYSSDESDNPRTVVGDKRWYPLPKNWVKSNPSITSGVPLPDYIQGRINSAITPTQRREVLRLNFGVWADTKTGYIDRDRLLECEVEKIEPKKGDKLWLGLDLAARDDFTALAYLWETQDKKLLMRVKAYTGLQTIPERDEESSGSLQDWVSEGYIVGTDGDQLDFNIVAQDIMSASERYDVQGLAIDPHKRFEFDKAMDEIGVRYHYEKDGSGSGVKVVIHPQGWQREGETGLSMHNSMQALEEMFYGKRIQFERHKVFQWALQSVVVKTSQDNRRMMNKRDSTGQNRGKIDVLVAAVMAAGLHKRGDYEPEGKQHNPWKGGGFDLMSLQKRLQQGQ